MKNGLAETMLECLELHDYKITTNLINSLGRLLTSGDSEIRRKMTHSGIL